MSNSEFLTGKRSRAAYMEAREVFPGGVNSPVRSWRSVGQSDSGPFFVLRGRGAEIVDLDGNHYLDLIGSWGPLILGHCNKHVITAVRKQAERGFSFGAPTDIETRLAKKVQEIFPSLEMMRFVSSGTEAVMHALRVARGFTNREKIIKFDGCFHGASDAMLVKAGSGAATFGVPDSAGIPEQVAKNTLVAPFNDLEAVKKLLDANLQQVAAIVLEPVVGNAGVLIPEEGFLQGLRKLATDTGTVLIFDEVMTGFRVMRGGAQELYDVKPDMTTLGKILGGGLPCAAYGGKKEIMKVVSPLGPVYQAGTLSGNPLAMAAGLATLGELEQDEHYDYLEVLGQEFETILMRAAKKHGWGKDVCINRVGSMFTLFFHSGPIKNFADASQSDSKVYAKFFQGMLKRGVYFPPSQYEAAFLNIAIETRHIKKFEQVALEVFEELE